MVLPVMIRDPPFFIHNVQPSFPFPNYLYLIISIFANLGLIPGGE